MLSRTAEKVYWIGRYLERTENTARLISVYANLLFDLPKNVPLGWELLPNIMGGWQVYNDHYEKVNETNAISFLTMDENFVGSIFNSVVSARENARTTREILPNEAWELINELYHFVNDNSSSIHARNQRNLFLRELTHRCQQITGMLGGSMNRDAAYDFMIMGRSLERADMTTRILDTGAITSLQPDDDYFTTYENILWLNVLSSLGGAQMFHKQVRDRIDQAGVLDFLLHNRIYPRSISHCLATFESSLNSLPDHASTQRCISHTKLYLKNDNIQSLKGSSLHEFLDKLQMHFNEIHSEVASSWFSLETQTQQEKSA